MTWIPISAPKGKNKVTKQVLLVRFSSRNCNWNCSALSKPWITDYCRACFGLPCNFFDNNGCFVDGTRSRCANRCSGADDAWWFFCCYVFSTRSVGNSRVWNLCWFSNLLVCLGFDNLSTCIFLVVMAEKSHIVKSNTNDTLVLNRADSDPIMNRAILLSIVMITCSISNVFMFEQQNSLDEENQDLSSARNPSNLVISPSSGSHFGGDNITLTGSGFSSFFPATDPWENFTIDSSANVGQYSSIVADSNSELHIAYHDATNGHLKYASNTGGSWNYYPHRQCRWAIHRKIHIN